MWEDKVINYHRLMKRKGIRNSFWFQGWTRLALTIRFFRFRIPQNVSLKNFAMFWIFCSFPAFLAKTRTCRRPEGERLSRSGGTVGCWANDTALRIPEKTGSHNPEFMWMPKRSFVPSEGKAAVSTYYRCLVVKKSRQISFLRCLEVETILNHVCLGGRPVE